MGCFPNRSSPRCPGKSLFNPASPGTLPLSSTMPTKRKLVTFDWALKRLLRSKANFAVLEGFLSELLHDDLRIV